MPYTHAVHRRLTMTRKSSLTWCIAFMLAGAAIAADSKPPATHPAATRPADKNVIDLFDGKTLKNWKSTEFGGEGAVEVENGQIVVGSGSSLSGINWVG